MILDSFLLAFRSIKNRRTRSWLTIIGILIGVAAVVALISLTQGLNQAVEEEFEQVGSDKITIMPGAGGAGGGMGPSLSSSVLYQSDVDAIRNIRGVEGVEPMLGGYTEVGYGTERKTVEVFGANPELFDQFPQFEIDEGRKIRPNDRFKAVVGSRAATDIFSQNLDVKNSIEIKDRKVRVVGIMAPVGNPRDDSSVMIPLETYRDIFKKENEVSVIYVDTEETLDVEKVADDIEDKLEDERGEKDFTVQTMEQIQKSVSNILGMIQGLFLGVAAISILVGGVGVMNTMYTSVLEKTREIGIMKAVGAKNSHVMIIFLFESGILGLVGGTIGIGLGIGIAKLAEYGIQESFGLGMMQTAITPELILGALVFSFGIGTVSGLLPARKAAKLNPADALRYE